MSSRSLSGVAALLLVSALGPVARSDESRLRVAVVDVERCVQESEDGLRATAKLRKLRLRHATLVRVWRDELERLRAAHAGSDDPVARAQLAIELALESASLERATAAFEQEETSLERQLREAILTRVRATIARVGAEKGYDLVVDHVALGLAADDITNVVLARQDAE